MSAAGGDSRRATNTDGAAEEPWRIAGNKIEETST